MKGRERENSMIQKIMDDIYQIGIDLPGSPLKLLNSYLILGDRNLLIDTGFNRPECLQSLTESLGELGVDMCKTDIFLTHFHTDHSGLVSSIATADTTIYIGNVDRVLLERTGGDHSFWNDMSDRYIKEGLSEQIVIENRTSNPARIYVTKHLFPYTGVFDGDMIKVGKYDFRCIYTPGHTPGHTCLYCEKEELIFLGDQLLYDITPNITMWPMMEDSLRQYLNSLDKIEKLSVKTALVGHRTNLPHYYQRIGELKNHHRQRLADIYQIVAAQQGLNACEIAAYMKWSIRARNWDEFPSPQKWFAVGETLAHLNYLMEEGKIIQHKGKKNTYYLKV